MTDAVLFSIFNVGIGFAISWLLGHYVLPALPFIEYKRSIRGTTVITLIYTVAAIIRNIGVYTVWMY